MKNTKSSFPQQGPLFKGLNILGHKRHLLLLQQGTKKCHYFLHWKHLLPYQVMLIGDDNFAFFSLSPIRAQKIGAQLHIEEEIQHRFPAEQLWWEEEESSRWL